MLKKAGVTSGVAGSRAPFNGVPRPSAKPSQRCSGREVGNDRASLVAAQHPFRDSSSDAEPCSTSRIQASRRAVLLSGLALMGGIAGAGAGAARAEEAAPEAPVAPVATPSAPSGPVAYKDEADRFSLAVPAGWVQGEGSIQGSAGGFTSSNGSRRTVAWFPSDVPARDVNVTVVISNVSVEFTKLGSFGNVATFASNLVNSLDRSYQLNRPAWGRRSDEPVQIAKLVDYKEVKGGQQYFVEYTVQKLPEPKRHLLSTLALGSNGRYNRLYTVTAQCSEEQLPKYKATLQSIIDSFNADVKTLI